MLPPKAADAARQHGSFIRGPLDVTCRMQVSLQDCCKLGSLPPPRRLVALHHLSLCLRCVSRAFEILAPAI